MTVSSATPIPYAVVYDLEFTAWEWSMDTRWMDPGHYKEVVQIGAVKVDGSFSPLETLDVLVRPRLNPVLTDYLTALTRITNADIAARGLDFVEAYRAFAEFTGGFPIVAFGRDDKVIADNVRLYGIEGLPALPRYLDIRIWLAQNGMDVRGMHACDVGPAAGVSFAGHKHDGLCDALSVAAGIKALMERGAPRPEVE